MQRLRKHKQRQKLLKNMLSSFLGGLIIYQPFRLHFLSYKYYFCNSCIESLFFNGFLSYIFRVFATAQTSCDYAFKNQALDQACIEKVSCIQCLGASGGFDFCVSTTSFQKIDIGWPRQPPTENLLKLNLIFHDSTKKLCFSKHQYNVKIS